MTRRLVGIVGIPQSGKSIVRQTFEVARYHRLRFTDPARSMLAAAGIPAENLDGPRVREPLACAGGKVGHELVQSLCDWGRQSAGRAFWLDQYRMAAESLDGPLVTDDVKTLDEVALMRAMGGVMVCVVRPGIVPLNSRAEAFFAKLNPEHEILNDGDRLDLEAKAGKLAAQLWPDA